MSAVQLKIKLVPLEGKTGNSVSFSVAARDDNFNATCQVKIMQHV